MPAVVSLMGLDQMENMLNATPSPISASKYGLTTRRREDSWNERYPRDFGMAAHGLL